MQQTRLGETDLSVSTICFGTWQAGGDWGEIDTEQAKAAARARSSSGSTSSTPPRRMGGAAPSACSARRWLPSFAPGATTS